MSDKKTVLLGVTGGIAAYKMPNLVSMLAKVKAETHVILTRNAMNIIPPTPFESLSKKLLPYQIRHTS